MYYKISGLTRGLRGYYNKWETQKALIEINNKLMEKVLSQVNQEFTTMTESLTSVDLKDKVAKAVEKYKAQLLVPIAKENGVLLTKAFNEIRYEAVLNKCQY